MTDETDSEYPSIRKALSDDDAVANIWCGIKWIAWQAIHLWLFIILSPFIAVLLIGRGVHAVGEKLGVGQYIRPVGQAIERVLTWVGRSRPAIFVLTWSAWVMKGVIVFAAVLVFGPPLLVLEVAGYIWGETRVGTYGRAVLTKLGLMKTKTVETAAETPGVRRIIGECPVSFDIEPRWFSKIESALDL